MVTLEEFLERLIQLGADRGPRNFPRRRSDREILMKSVLLLLDSGRSYSEAEINQCLQTWFAEVVPTIRGDHVTLRRMLVDYGHLERTPDGSAYRVGFPARATAFALEVDEVDVRATVAAYLREHPLRHGGG